MTIPPSRKRAIRRRLLNWYKEAARDLPWRKTHNPYHILVSEVMLQQTQVDRVIIKYKEFLHRFPSITSLAKASAADVIGAWKGLGYNRRALFLQKTAQAIRTTHRGQFPKDHEQLIELPGVGDYTARAVMSFAFKQAVPMMDTNHRRFYQRIFFGMDLKKDRELLGVAEHIIPKKDAYNWNQALMDFGSSICTTRNPRCEICPLQQFCKAYPGILTLAPSASKKKKKHIPFKQTDRYVRGRIIDALRDNDQLSIVSLAKKFPHIDKERYERILTQLEKDGLIKRTKEVIMFP